MPEARPAFARDSRRQRASAALKGAWWGAAGQVSQRLTRPGQGEEAVKFATDTPRPDPAVTRRKWASAFEKDARDIASGLYPAGEQHLPSPASFARTLDVLADGRRVDARRRRADGFEVRNEEGSEGYPAYYRQNFHYQTGGWFSPESAQRYEPQVELLFAGTAAAMRRRALALLAKAWRDRDHRGLRMLDLACGAGGFLVDLRRAFPRAQTIGLDLSPAYLAEAGRTADASRVQANAERLPFADASLDAVSCIYLFHELPPKLRPVIAAEIARVLKPGGVLAFADAVQFSDEPDLRRLLEAFPAYFHEPYFDSFQAADLPALFESTGLRQVDEDQAFLTKARLFQK